MESIQSFAHHQLGQPIHFFTLVLNGQPLIQYHLQVFQRLPMPWHWHVIEGVASLEHDTAWSIAQGGRVDPTLHHEGLSIDGTTEYLDHISAKYPEQVTLYRLPSDQFWNGKREMVNAPLSNIQEDCLLWQIDVDEFWTVSQIITTYQLFQESPERTAAFYWCHYFVGPELVVSSRNCYSQNPQQEWLRTWRYKPGMLWVSHEPPKLVNINGQDVGFLNPFSHAETEEAGLIFQHFAYVLPKQISFKQTYYGYQNLLGQWQRLQAEPYFPVFLADYFSWITDDTIVDRAESCGTLPLAVFNPANETWHFRDETELATLPQPKPKPKPKIAIDAVFFQFQWSGISRVWHSILKEWVKSGFAEQVLILDRKKTAPRIPGLYYRQIHLYNQELAGQDSLKLQEICGQEKIELFLSTYYTTPTSIPSILIIHDMIPEVVGFNLNAPEWQEKQLAILHASAYITVSKNTARDLVKFYPGLPENRIHVCYCGLDPQFHAADEFKIKDFNEKYDLEKPYFLVVGDRFGLNGYKNISLFFQAFSKLSNKVDYQIFCVGGQSNLEPELAALVPSINVKISQLSDQELITAYSGAIALVYPSRYEGFGLPILEAMACDCPVITCDNSAIREVAGDAALYVNEDDPFEMINALDKVQVPTIREELIRSGREQSQSFSWSAMAGQIAEVINGVIKKKSEERLTSLTFKQDLIWGTLRQLQSDLEEQKNIYQEYKILQDLLFIMREMESSKFWQLRRIIKTLQVLLGKPNLPDEAIVDSTAHPKLQSIQIRKRINWMKTSKFWKLRKWYLHLREKICIPGDNPDSPIL